MRKRTAMRFGAVIIAVVAGAFALTASAGGYISPVADQIAYMSMVDGEADIYTMTPTGYANFNLTHDETTGERSDVEPAWSPQGEVVAFQRDFLKGDQMGSQLYLVAADGTKLGPLTTPLKGTVDMHPSWSPDGQSVVFSSDRDGNFDLYVYTINSDQLIQLTDTKPGTENVQPAWSPNGQMIVFSRYRDTVTPSPANLVVLNVKSGRMYKLTSPLLMGRGDRDAAWSPDSRWIAFTSDRMGPSVIASDDLFVVNVDRSALTRLTSLSSNEYHPTWSPRGDQLAFVSDRKGMTEIYSLDLPLPDGTVTPITNKFTQLTFDGAHKSNPTWYGRAGMGLTH